MHEEDSESKLLDKEKMNMNYGIMKINAKEPLFFMRISNGISKVQKWGQWLYQGNEIQDLVQLMWRNWTLFEFGMNIQRSIYNQEVTNEIKVASTKSQDYENVISNNRFLGA